MATDYSGPYDGLAEPSGQVRTQALPLTALPDSSLTATQVLALAVPGLGPAQVNFVVGSTGGFGALAVMTGQVVWPLARLVAPAAIAAVAMLGGESLDQVTGVLALPVPLAVTPGPEIVTLTLILTAFDSLTEG